MSGFIGAGSVVRAYNAALSPTKTVTVGNLLVLRSQCYSGNVFAPAVTGWTLRAPATINNIGVWTQTATSTSASATVNWGTINADADAWIEEYNGFLETVHAESEKQSNQRSAVSYANLTITTPNTLV